MVTADEIRRAPAGSTDHVPAALSGAVERESFYAIRLTDGDLIYGEYAWMGCDGPNDWTVAEESDDTEPTGWEIVRMWVEPIAKRTFGDPRDLHERVHRSGEPPVASLAREECDYCGEPWPCEYIAALDQEKVISDPIPGISDPATDSAGRLVADIEGDLP